MVQKLTGLVLRTTEYKESDLILNILTREQGLISAKARAVRTNRSHDKADRVVQRDDRQQDVDQRA